MIWLVLKAGDLKCIFFLVNELHFGHIFFLGQLLIFAKILRPLLKYFLLQAAALLKYFKQLIGKCNFLF